MNGADKYNLIDLSDLIGFGYDLSDTQDGLKCWRMGIIFCGLHPLLLTRIQVSYIQGPWALLYYDFTTLIFMNMQIRLFTYLPQEERHVFKL